MKNAIRYYYQLEAEDIKYINNRYYFDLYVLTEYIKDVDINIYHYLSKNNIPNYEIIWNKDDNYITSIDDKKYILLKKNRHMPISFSALENFYIPTNTKEIIPWHELWATKVDYYEKHIQTLSSKKLKETFHYYIGLTENAILFYKQIKKETNLFISHSRLSTDEDFLNPLNFNIDYRVRDVAEYIKNLFFKENLNIKEAYEFIAKNNFDNQDLLLFYNRLLYPSYYFDCYDKISKGESDSCLDIIINNITKYENFLHEMYYYIRQFTNILKIDWIIGEKQL